MASLFTQFPLNESSPGVALHAAYRELVDALNSYGEWLYDPYGQYPLIAQAPGSVMRYNLVRPSNSQYWYSWLKDRVKSWATSAGYIAASPTNPPYNNNWFVAYGWVACCQELFGIDDWPDRQTGQNRPAVAAEFNDMWRVICWCSGKWFRYNNNLRHPNWPNPETTGYHMAWPNGEVSYPRDEYTSKEAACGAYDSCGEQAISSYLRAGSDARYGSSLDYDTGQDTYYVWAYADDWGCHRDAMAVGTFKAPPAGAILGAKFKFSFENHHLTDDPDRDPVHESLRDPNGSPCPVRLYLGTNEPARGFAARCYGSQWFSEDMAGTGLLDYGPYLEYHIRDLDPATVTPGSWHWYRLAGRDTMGGDILDVDWPWSLPDYDPAYTEWVSNWGLSELYFQVQWAYH